MINNGLSNVHLPSKECPVVAVAVDLYSVHDQHISHLLTTSRDKKSFNRNFLVK